MKDYKPPKDSDKYDDITRQLMSQGCAPGISAPAAEEEDEDFILPLPEEQKVHSNLRAIKNEPAWETASSKGKEKDDRQDKLKKSKKSKSSKKKHRKEKKHKKEKSRKRRRNSSSSESSDSSESSSDDESNSRRRKSRH